ncbi:hypothetical protein M407DRAFT_99149 [Tulasnella calospora MUT 4182]|uniref:Uncharacterized protein n=1 Tax=Tulasnella calospora MUT 4182 TaxID=1051891 RepID=A0A0C3Q5Z8_9AGAM|nr:hypothetical protein M407DRAFT_99149 [Tulasnella calospora MUT 4182]
MHSFVSLTIRYWNAYSDSPRGMREICHHSSLSPSMSYKPCSSTQAISHPTWGNNRVPFSSQDSGTWRTCGSGPSLWCSRFLAEIWP